MKKEPHNREPERIAELSQALAEHTTAIDGIASIDKEEKQDKVEFEQAQQRFQTRQHDREMKRTTLVKAAELAQVQVKAKSLNVHSAL